ncbi:15-hydroxyprostaglandin dehydrogenase [NAD(+)]-like [Pectinophora gossypiella]|uniref:15-hydroxyprostaglandin dehydrogenase [NAD(+)]-like n=1 Tax=Pectinophora gossypiella TaxID=13191 RepID=UPI00214EF3EC|nr:15-hydroxyprostaglandin dehydrogenase [NAD(+)]-like [Pectinophora gossypiella]
MYQIKDKVFLVTGGAAGIGAGVTQAFLEQGAKHVAALDLNETSGKKLESELAAKYGQNKITFYKCDVTTKNLEDCIDAVYKKLGYIDCVVNCAGILNDGPSMMVRAIEVNVTALIRSSMKALELMRKDHGGKGGTIVNISSIAGIFPCTSLPIYCATKSAVLQFSNCLGSEPHYPRTGVRVITMCFGCTDTALLNSNNYRAIDKETDDEEAITNLVKKLPMQKPESAVKGIIEAYKRGASASTWLVSADRAAEDITENVKKGYQIMSQGVFDKNTA